MPADLATNLSLVLSIDSKQRMSDSIGRSSQERNGIYTSFEYAVFGQELKD